MNENVKVVFDVDGTLIHFSHTGENVPRYDIIDLFRTFEKLGCEMYIWSGGGVEYANRWSERLNLKAKIVPKGSFCPNIAVDDCDSDLGSTNILVTEVI